MNDLKKPVHSLPPEQESIRVKCVHPAGNFVEFSKEEVAQSIPDRFEKIVRLYPDRIAVKAREQAFTYDALNRQANRIAWSIYKARGATVEPVVLVSQSEVNSIASCLGILKAGKIPAIIDPSFPFDRVHSIVKNSRPGAIVTDRDSRSFIQRLTTDNLRLMDIDALDANLSDSNLALRISPETPAQIVYSSGSTGEPKGIFFNHRRMLHDIMVYVNTTHLCPDDRIIQLRKLSFGAGIKDLFRTLLSGASIYPYAINEAGMARLAAFLADEKITVYSPGASIFRHFINQLSGAEKFPSVRLVVLGGGGISKDDVEAYRRVFSDDCLLLHHLSSTETGLVCQYFINKQSKLDAAVAPVGYPIDGKEVLLLDENGRNVGSESVGEIAVRSRYVSSGYWGNPELTNSRFAPDPDHPDQRICLTGDLGRMEPDGRLFHLGRKDFLVKLRGYRVDITEVEHALLAHPNVKEAGVAVWERDTGEKYLAGYVVPREQPAPDPSDLRAFLREKLPDYMIPSVFMLMSSLPLTNRKLDRKALPKPDGKRPAFGQPYVPPQSEIEHRLVEIWEHALSVRPVGIHDSFFDLGGHSLSAARIIAKLNETFGVQLSMRGLLDAPTVAELAGILAVLCGTEEKAHQILRREAAGEETGEI